MIPRLETQLLKGESFLSSFQPLRCILRNLRFHYLVQRSLLLVSVMSQLNHFHICMSCPFVTHFNIVAHQRTGFVIGPFTPAAITVPCFWCLHACSLFRRFHWPWIGRHTSWSSSLCNFCILSFLPCRFVFSPQHLFSNTPNQFCCPAQTVSSSPVTAEARLWYQVSPCGICGAQSSICTGFLRCCWYGL